MVRADQPGTNYNHDSSSDQPCAYDNHEPGANQPSDNNHKSR